MNAFIGSTSSTLSGNEETILDAVLKENGRNAQLVVASWVSQKVPKADQHEELKLLLSMLGLDELRDEYWVFGPSSKKRHRPGGAVKDDNLPRTMCNRVIKDTWSLGSGGSRTRCADCNAMYFNGISNRQRSWQRGQNAV